MMSDCDEEYEEKIAVEQHPNIEITSSTADDNWGSETSTSSSKSSWLEHVISCGMNVVDVLFLTARSWRLHQGKQMNRDGELWQKKNPDVYASVSDREVEERELIQHMLDILPLSQGEAAGAVHEYTDEKVSSVNAVARTYLKCQSSVVLCDRMKETFEKGSKKWNLYQGCRDDNAKRMDHMRAVMLTNYTYGERDVASMQEVVDVSQIMGRALTTAKVTDLAEGVYTSVYDEDYHGLTQGETLSTANAKECEQEKVIESETSAEQYSDDETNMEQLPIVTKQPTTISGSFDISPDITKEDSNAEQVWQQVDEMKMCDSYSNGDREYSTSPALLRPSVEGGVLSLHGYKERSLKTKKHRHALLTS